jgi:Tfp pilus assembly protein PilO
MANLSENKLILIFALSGVVLSGLAFGGVYWARGKIDEEKNSIENLETKIKKAAAKKARIPKDEEAVIVLRENLREYVKILPEAAELNDFARTVTSFVKSSGIALKTLTPGKGGKSKGVFSKYTYKMNFTGNLWQFMKFMNAFESYKRFVRVTSFRLTAGKRGKGVIGDINHGYSMTIETFVYNKKAGKKPVPIPDYSKKKSRLREKIFKERASINIDEYVFKGKRSRRDIFVDPRPDVLGVEGAGAVGRLPRKEQEEILKDLLGQVAHIRELKRRARETKVVLERFEFSRKASKMLIKVKEKILEVQEKELLTDQSISYRFQREVRDAIDAMEKKGKEKAVGLRMDELNTIRRYLEDALIDGRLDDAVDKFSEVEQHLIFPTQDPRRGVAGRIRTLYKKARVGQEFSRIKLEITGTIVIGKGLSTAIVNGKTFQEGDPIDADLFLKKVGEEWCEFLFKGVAIRKRVR